MDKECKKMKKFSNRKRRPTDYKEGNTVLVIFNPRQFKAPRGIHQNLMQKYEGPFKIVVKMGKILYKLELSPHFKIRCFMQACSSHTMRTRRILARPDRKGNT